MTTDLTEFRGSIQPASERAALEERLTFCRRGAIARIEDLDDVAAAALPLPKTNLTVGGLIKHLARTEDGWFVRTFAGQPMPSPWSDSSTQMQIASQSESLDATAAQASFGKGHVTLRWLFVHMVTETAWHLGHLDLLRDALGAPGIPD